MTKPESGANVPVQSDTAAASLERARAASKPRLLEIKAEISERARKRYERGRHAILEEIAQATAKGDRGAVINLQDVVLKELSERQEMIAKLAPELAKERLRGELEGQTDSISGLLRKDGFQNFYEHSLANLNADEKDKKRTDERMVIIAFDLDKFKDINETVGHVEADKILKNIGDAINRAIRAEDCATRIGGDEFMILLNHVKRGADTLQLVQRIGQALSEVRWESAPGQMSPISFSVGYTIVGHGETPYFDDVRQKADFNSGLSKKMGRNRVARTMSDGTFEVYELRPTASGAMEYVLDKKGRIDDYKNTQETCLLEVESNLQRVFEEIHLFWSHQQADLISYLKSKYDKNNLRYLTIRQIAEILFVIRGKKEAAGK